MNSDNDVVVLSEKEEYVNGVKSFVKNFLYLDNLCVIDGNHAMGNPGIIERLEWEHRQGRNIIIVGGNREERDYFEIISWAEDFFRKERVFWARNLMCIKLLAKELKK